jgi:teichuronic acid biosynthesis glycosyltransferase TuaC
VTAQSGAAPPGETMWGEAGPSPIHILSIATLFPDASRPHFGIFVERSLAALAQQPGVTLTVVAPVGLPPWPLSMHPRYAALRHLPRTEHWHGLTVLRPRFAVLPGMGARFHAAAIARAVLPMARRMRDAGLLDVIDAQFFHPDGPAAHRIAAALALPFSVKARGSDISLWARRPDTGPAIAAAAHAAGGLLAVGKAIRADMIAIGLPGDTITVHYTGLDAERFRPMDRAVARAEWGVPADAPVLATVGALIARKGQARVIAAMAHLPPDTRYLVAGAGPDADTLRLAAQAAGVAERVQFLGPVANARLPSLYNAADAMVLPSSSEGLANAWVEALGCGTPLVLADIPPAHEMIVDPESGRVVASDPVAIAAGVRDLLTHPPDRAALAAATATRFDWNRNGRELAAHLRTVAASAATSKNLASKVKQVSEGSMPP